MYSQQPLEAYWDNISALQKEENKNRPTHIETKLVVAKGIRVCGGDGLGVWD